MKIDLSELERKLSYGINLTIKESTILIESTKGFIDDKIELQEQLNTAKKALTESEKMYQKQMDRFLNSEMNKSARSHCESQLKLLFPAHKAYEALAAIGGDDDENRL